MARSSSALLPAKRGGRIASSGGPPEPGDASWQEVQEVLENFIGSAFANVSEAVDLIQAPKQLLGLTDERRRHKCEIV